MPIVSQVQVIYAPWHWFGSHVVHTGRSEVGNGSEGEVSKTGRGLDYVKAARRMVQLCFAGAVRCSVGLAGEAKTANLKTSFRAVTVPAAELLVYRMPVLSEARSVFDTMTCEAAKKQAVFAFARLGCFAASPRKTRHVVRHLAEPCLVCMPRMA